MTLTEEQLDFWGKRLLEKIQKSDLKEMHLFHAFLEELVRRTERKMDGVIAICGPRGYGKTTLALVSSLILRQLLPRNEEAAFTWDNICYHYDDIGDVIEKASANSIRVYPIDEAIDVMDARDSMSKVNKELGRFMTKARKKKNIYFWCIPSFVDLDSRLRNNIIHFWIEIFWKSNHADEDKRYAYAAFFAKDSDPTVRDKWGFDDLKKTRRSTYTAEEQLKLMKRMRGFVCVIAFPMLPKVIEDEYEQTSFEALEDAGKAFKATFMKKQEEHRAEMLPKLA